MILTTHEKNTPGLPDNVFPPVSKYPSSNDTIYSMVLQKQSTTGTDELAENGRRSCCCNSIQVTRHFIQRKTCKECGTMFGENAKQFLESIDANPYLIGFDNGVYDLQADEFRDGRSEDFITFSTGYDYIDYGT